MSSFDLILDEFRNIIAIIAVELVLIMPFMEKRNRFALRLIVGIVVCLAFSNLYIYVHDFLVASQNTAAQISISIVWYTAILLLTGGLMATCFKMNITEVVWLLLTAYAAQHTVYVLVNELICYGLFENKLNQWLVLLIYAVMAAVVCFIVYRMFVPSLKARKHLYIQHSLQNCLAMCVFLAVFLISAFVNQANARQDYTKINYLSVASDFINCILVIVVQYISMRTSRIRDEKETLRVLLENEKEQYDRFKNTVDYINLKCHDLKHEIAAMQREGNLNLTRLHEATQNIAVYEAFAKTGNETLDILLTDKNLICIGKGITLSYMADASGLSNMDATDIYVLFGNLLDNAIEYVSGLDEDKRFIRLFIRTRGHMKFIHQENYFEGDLTLSSGLPQTTKPDKIYHGFGTKSMRRIAEKYGGDMQITTEDNLFKIDIIIAK